MERASLRLATGQLGRCRVFVSETSRLRRVPCRGPTLRGVPGQSHEQLTRRRFRSPMEPEVTNQSISNRAAHDRLSGGGIMEALRRATDWRKTPLGVNLQACAIDHAATCPL